MENIDYTDENWRQRESWRLKLVFKYKKAVEYSISSFTWKEKTEFLEQLIQYIRLIKAEDKAVSEFFLEKIIKPYKSKLKTAFSQQLFTTYFDRIFAWVEFEIITDEQFENLPEDQQGMTEEEFARFLDQVVSFMREKLQYLYVYEHNADQEHDPEALDGGTPLSSKGRPQRSAGDNLTKLNQEQTALLIHYLKSGRLILKNEYLTDKAAGMAFNILTGYSPNSLRTSLSEKEITMLHTKTNLTEVYNALTNLTLLIKNELSPPKKT